MVWPPRLVRSRVKAWLVALAHQQLQVRSQAQGYSGVCHTSAGRADPANGARRGSSTLGGLPAEFHRQEELASCAEAMGHLSLAKVLMFQHVPGRAKRSGWLRCHGIPACPRADHCAEFVQVHLAAQEQATAAGMLNLHHLLREFLQETGRQGRYVRHPRADAPGHGRGEVHPWHG